MRANFLKYVLNARIFMKFTFLSLYIRKSCIFSQNRKILNIPQRDAFAMLFKDFPIPLTGKDGKAFTNYLLWEKAIWNNFIAAVLIFNNTAVFLMIMFTLKPPNSIWRFYLFRSKRVAR
jgi:hypothetical protein